MSTEPKHSEGMPDPVGTPLTMKELTALLVKHYGLKEGMFNLMIEYQFGTGAVGPDENNTLPGVMIGISRVGVVAASKLGHTTIDAAEVNRPPKSKKKD